MITRMYTRDDLDAMEAEAKRHDGRPDAAWIGQFSLGSEGALILIRMARAALKAEIDYRMKNKQYIILEDGTCMTYALNETFSSYAPTQKPKGKD
jgi:hypothetical protein